MGTLEAAVVNPLRSLSPGAVTLNRLPAGKGGPPGPLQVMPAEFSSFPSSSPLLGGTDAPPRLQPGRGGPLVAEGMVALECPFPSQISQAGEEGGREGA